MPTYDYKCLSCGKVFELFQKITDEPQEKCLHCSGKAERLISPGLGIIFKGSGFYETDYKKKKEPISNSENKDSCKGCPESKCDLKKDKSQ